MKTPNWLYNENGEVRPELYTMSKLELDEKQAEIAGQPIPEWATWSDELKVLEFGDIIYIKPEYSVASKFAGRMIFIQLSGNAMFCRTEDGGGGFIEPEMLLDQKNPTLFNLNANK